MTKIGFLAQFSWTRNFVEEVSSSKSSAALTD